MSHVPCQLEAMMVLCADQAIVAANVPVQAGSMRGLQDQ